MTIEFLFRLFFRTDPDAWYIDGRYNTLHCALAGYEKSGIPLVCYSGAQYHVPNPTDDAGIYYFVPKLASILNIPVDSAIAVFNLAVVAISFSVFLTGFFLMFKTRISKVLVLASAFGIYFTFKTAMIYDVYSTPFIAALGFSPLFIYFYRKDFPKISAVYLGASGLLLGAADAIRIHSGSPLVLFAVVTIMTCAGQAMRRRIILAAVLLAGFVIPSLFFKAALARRDAFLDTPRANGVKHHVVWHTIYCGLGWFDNDLGLRWDDGTAAGKVKELAPGAVFGSMEYERTLREEVLRVVRGHPKFVLKVLLLKLAKIIRQLVIFANVGILVFFLYPKRASFELGFWSAMSVQALSGLLSAPTSAYLSGFIALAMVYNVLRMNEAIEHEIGRAGEKSAA